MNPDITESGVRLPLTPAGIAFDLDGTLLDYDGRLSDGVSRSVRLIARSGIKVFLISGRIQTGCEAFWRQLGLDTPIGSCNGAHVGIPGEEPIFHIRLSESARRTVMRLEREHGLYVNYYIDNHVYSLSDSPEREAYSRQFSHVEPLSGPDDLLGRRLPTKCLCIVPEAEHARCLNLFAEALDGVAVVTESNTRFIEILPPEANKGVALRAIADWCGEPTSRFIAVGDAMNDLPMLEEAGFAIAFKTGNPKLAEYVDMMLPPLWEDGISILARCILGMTDSGRFLTRSPKPADRE